MFKLKRPVLLLLAALLLAFAASCGGANAPSASPSTGAGSSASPSPSAAEPSPGATVAPKEIVTIKFSEVIRSIFYAPYYAAISQGYFEEEGLKLDMNTAQGSDKGAAALIAGTADISLVGPETAIYIYNQQGDKKLKVFYQLTMKDGSFLLSRSSVDAFDWHALAGKKIIGWRPGSAPQMVMASTLKAQGAEGTNVVTNIAAPAMAGAFASGQGDYIQLFEPVASTLIAEGKAYYAASLGETFGDFPRDVVRRDFGLHRQKSGDRSRLRECRRQGDPLAGERVRRRDRNGALALFRRDAEGEDRRIRPSLSEPGYVAGHAGADARSVRQASKRADRQWRAEGRG
ncbi:ABC transporter substrate-binding protein [Cohnella rhizosphaerae]|uniref:ABC transporter substrate-binding protein n=1 Tax=Cohnella rhizosphaerae TaxID=1457232 RepID=A0A9X4KN02_9BACL|nr:ABC transporter substrate-binding protein [Cohnella rhizosphaerae]MDG0808011.1 ABC transporter substrate-binding protein [Cohnella rhizosphaerae]